MVNADKFLSELGIITEQYRKSLTAPHTEWRPLADLLVATIMEDVNWGEIKKEDARAMTLHWNDMADYVRNMLADRLGME